MSPRKPSLSLCIFPSSHLRATFHLFRFPSTQSHHAPFVLITFHQCSTSHPFGLKEIENEKGRNNISLDISLHCNFNYSIHPLQPSSQSDRNAYFFLINRSFRILYSFIMYIYIYIYGARDSGRKLPEDPRCIR